MSFATTAQRVVVGAHTWLYRRSRGKVLGRFGQEPILLLHTVGRKTGEPRTTPLCYLRDGERLVLVASNGGNPKHPAWFLNLQAQPEAEVEVRGKRLRVRAEQVSPGEKARLWPRITSLYPGYESYQRRTTRDIPVVLLYPQFAKREAARA